VSNKDEKPPIEMVQLRQLASSALEWSMPRGVATDSRITIQILARISLQLENLLTEIKKSDAEREADDISKAETLRIVEAGDTTTVFLRTYKTKIGDKCRMDRWHIYRWFADGNKAPIPVKLHMYKTGSKKQIEWEEHFNKYGKEAVDNGFFSIIEEK
jgi:hypothetical protein